MHLKGTPCEDNSRCRNTATCSNFCSVLKALCVCSVGIMQYTYVSVPPAVTDMLASALKTSKYLSSTLFAFDLSACIQFRSLLTKSRERWANDVVNTCAGLVHARNTRLRDIDKVATLMAVFWPLSEAEFLQTRS